MGFCAKVEDNGALALKMEAKYWGEIGYYTFRNGRSLGLDEFD